MNRLRSWLQKSGEQKRLFLLALIVMPLCQLLLLLLPFRIITRMFHLAQVDPETIISISEIELVSAQNVAWALAAVIRTFPWLPVKCLGQALAGCLLLRFMRIPATVVLGVQLQAQPSMSAHAWLKCGELIICGGHERGDFSHIAGFIPQSFC